MKRADFFNVIALTLMACSLASASVLDLNIDDSKLKTGSIVEAYNSSFAVTGEENFYVQNGDFVIRYRMIFLENLNKIASIKRHVGTLEQSLSRENNTSSQMLDMITYKRNDNNQLSSRLKSLEKETSILGNQSKVSLASLEEINSDNKELGRMITGNFLVAPGQTTGLLVIFTILIAAVIAIEFRAYFSSVKNDTRSEKEEKK